MCIHCDPDVIAANLAALKHEAETPMRGHGECCEPAPADVDPDEALAMDLYHDSLLIPPVKEIGPTAWLSERDHEMWLGVARTAREHIEANQLYAYRPAAAERDKAEADLARVTAENARLRAGIEALADWHETKAEKAARFRPETNGENRVMDKAAQVHRDADSRLRALLNPPTEGETDDRR